MNKIKSFYLLPTIIFTKTTNHLTKEAKATFNSNWNYYITLRIGWLFWDKFFYYKIK